MLCSVVAPEGGRGADSPLVGGPYPPCRGKIDNSPTKLVFLTIKNCKKLEVTFFLIVKNADFLFSIVKNTSFLDEFPRQINNFPGLLISKALFIDLARPKLCLSAVAIICR